MICREGKKETRVIRSPDCFVLLSVYFRTGGGGRKRKRRSLFLRIGEREGGERGANRFSFLSIIHDVRKGEGRGGEGDFQIRSKENRAGKKRKERVPLLLFQPHI